MGIKHKYKIQAVNNKMPEMEESPSESQSPEKSKAGGLIFKIGNKAAWIPPGIYEAMVIRVEQKFRYKKNCLDFIFEIASGEHKGTELKGFINVDYQTFSENTKLYQWYMRATGDALQPGDELDTDDFKNKVLEVKVEDKVSKKTKLKLSNITDILQVIREL